MYDAIVEFGLILLAAIGLILSIAAIRRFRLIGVDPVAYSFSGTLGMLIAGILMISFSQVITITQTTIFNDGGLSLLAYDPYVNDEVKHLLEYGGVEDIIPYEAVIFLISFLKLLGLYGMAKALFLLYEASQSTLQRGRTFFSVATHLICGAILFNIGYVSCLVSKTFSSLVGTQWNFCL